MRRGAGGYKVPGTRHVLRGPSQVLKGTALIKLFSLERDIREEMLEKLRLRYVKKIKILPRKTRPTKDLKRSWGGTEGGDEIVFTHRNCLRSWSAPFPSHLDYSLCLRVSDDIDAVIWVKND